MSRTTGRKRKDRPRIVGTFSERVLLHQLAQEVLNKMEILHPELDVDNEALQHIRIGFLREPCRNLLGYCSYSDNSKSRPKTEYSERHRVHRILMSRQHMNDDLEDAIITMHHEFLHAILGSDEAHGPIFQKHEPRISKNIVQIVERIRNFQIFRLEAFPIPT